jgi:hypothetical protein
MVDGTGVAVMVVVTSPAPEVVRERDVCEKVPLALAVATSPVDKSYPRRSVADNALPLAVNAPWYKVSTTTPSPLDAPE